MKYIQCSNCGTLYIIEDIESDVCENCRKEMDTIEIIQEYKIEKQRKKEIELNKH